MGATTGMRPAAMEPSRWRAARVLAAFLLFVAIIAAGMIGGSALDHLVRHPQWGSAVPDTLLQMTYDQHTRQERVVAYLPGSNAPYPLLENGYDPIVSPDGAQIVLTERQQDGGTARYAVVAFAGGSLARQWRAEIAAVPTESQQTPALNLSAAITADRVYVTGHMWQSADPVTVVALDRTDGRERARWTVDLAGESVGGLSLRAAPDGSFLALLASLQTGTGINVASHTAFFRFRLPDGQEIQRIPRLTQTGDGSFYSLAAPITPDGHTLYQLGYGDSPSRLVLRFFDLQNGAIQPALALPFQTHDDFLTYEQAISHDGRRLYVLAPTLRSLVIVNLMTQRIEEQTPIDTSAINAAGGGSLFARVFGMVRGVFIQDAVAKGPLLGAMQLSPDGRRLYAVSAATARQGSEAEPDGIWVIDTNTWRVTDQWLPKTAPSALLLSADGRYLTVEQGQGGMRTLDAASGNERFATGSEAYSTLTSLTQLYRDRYGTSPNGGTRAGNIQTLPPFAALTAAVNTNAVLAGDAVTIEARFINPTNGAPVAQGMPGVRYDPPATVTATLSPPSGNGDDRESIPLTAMGYGVYRGTVTLADGGSRSLSVLARWDRDDVPNRQTVVENAVTVQAAFVGTDGRRYIAKVTADPAQPVVKQAATIHIAFVDAKDGTPLPGGVTVMGGLPPTLDADFFPESAGYLLETFRATGHGVYTSTGPVTLWVPGSWRVILHVPTATGTTRDAPIGAVQAVSG